MSRIMLAAGLATLAVAAWIAPVQAATATEVGTREFELEHIEPAQAAVALRSIAGTKQLEIHGRRVGITDTPEGLDVAERLLEMIDLPSPIAGAFESYAAPSGDAVIASFGLRPGMAPEAMAALRKILKIQRLAVAHDGAFLVLRDTPEQVEAAWALVQIVERTPDQKQTAGAENGMEAQSCSVQCPGRVPPTGGSVTCRPGYRAVCECDNPDKIAFCLPTAGANGPGAKSNPFEPVRPQLPRPPKGVHPMPQIAKGTFEVTLKPLAVEGAAEKSSLGRMSIDKTISGDLVATTKGQMLSAGTATKGSAGYVAMEQVTGTLAGREGSFILQHSATMDRGAPSMSIRVVPDSGSGDLKGLAGDFKIDIVDGKHFYEFDYRFDEGRTEAGGT